MSARILVTSPMSQVFRVPPTFVVWITRQCTGGPKGSEVAARAGELTSANGQSNHSRRRLPRHLLLQCLITLVIGRSRWNRGRASHDNASLHGLPGSACRCARLGDIFL